MENYFLYDQISGSIVGKTTYKGRKRGNVNFSGLSQWEKAWKTHVTNEVRLLSTLGHENVLQFKEWYETSHHIWVITELASGGSLAELLLQDGFVPLERMPEFVKDIALGLNYVHSHNIIYCDLQPEKIVLASCGSLKLSDFTLAFKVGEKAPFTLPPKHILTQSLPPSSHSPQVTSEYEARSDSTSPELCPSILYMAPECLRGGEYSLRCDLWSLGCVVFELCTGLKPFVGDSVDTILQSTSQPLNFHFPGTGTRHDAEVVSTLITGLLQTSPQQRLSWDQLLSLDVF